MAIRYFFAHLVYRVQFFSTVVADERSRYLRLSQQAGCELTGVRYARSGPIGRLGTDGRIGLVQQARVSDFKLGTGWRKRFVAWYLVVP